MSKKESNPKPPDISMKPPPPPKPPLHRHLREDGGWGTCLKCGSSMVKTKLFFFGKKRCIQPECGYEI